MESLPNRPPPARPLGEAVTAWVAWFGVVRLIVIVASVLGVGAGAYWLLRAPATPVETSTNTPSAASDLALTMIISAPPNMDSPQLISADEGTGVTAARTIATSPRP